MDNPNGSFVSGCQEDQPKRGRKGEEGGSTGTASDINIKHHKPQYIILLLGENAAASPLVLSMICMITKNLAVECTLECGQK